MNIMSESLEHLAFEILKAKYDLKSLSNADIYEHYWEIRKDLYQLDKDRPKSKSKLSVLM